MKINRFRYTVFVFLILWSCSTSDKIEIYSHKPLINEIDLSKSVSNGYTYFRVKNSLNKVKMKNYLINVDEKQFQLFLIDLDSNNCFSNTGKDKIGIALDNDNSFSQDGFFIGDLRDTLQFKLDQDFYQAYQFDCDGQFEIKRVNSASDKIDFYLNTNVNSSVELTHLFSKEKSTMEKLSVDKKLTYFGFWGTWCSFCVKYLPYSDSIASLPDTELVYVNFLDQTEKARAFVSEYQMKGKHYKMEVGDQKKIGISSFPSGIIVGKDNKILKSNISPDSALHYLKKITSKKT